MNDMTVIVAANPVACLTDAKTYSEFYEAMRQEVESHVPDLTTEKGRKAIATLARKVATTKVTIDDAGKALNEEARAKINAVDEARRKIRVELDALRDLARKPLTEWEEAEAARLDHAKSVIRHIEEVASGFIGGESQPFPILLHELEEKVIIDSSFGEFEETARTTLRLAQERLTAAFEAHKKAEADRVELEGLRAEAEARAEADRLVAEKKAAEEQQRQAKAASEAQAAKEAAEREEQIRLAAKAAEESATKEAQRIADEARLAQEKAHADALAAEKKRADDAEAARAAEAERVRLEQVEAKRLADEQAARDKDRAHRGAVMGEAKAYLIDLGLEAALAKTVVLAIVAGSVPHVSLRF